MADEAAEVERRIGQEGSRWFNAMPSGEELASWFGENVDLHDGLEASDYVQGVTLIPGTEKSKTVIGWKDNAPVIETVENLVFTPYAKVETRVKYFHDLMAKHDDWLGVIEPVPPKSSPATLPPGFFRYAVQTNDGTVNYVCCSMKVTIFEKDSIEWREFRNTDTGSIERVRTGKVLLDAAPATKMIATMRRFGPDEFALMKAETGAVGRALGMAGMLVIPGTGIATAEDMQEAQGLEGSGGQVEPEQVKPPVEAQPAAPPSEEAITELRQRAIHIIGLLKAEFPPEFEEFKAWAASRQIGEVAKVEDVRVLEGLIRKADRDLTNARGNAAKPDEPPAKPDERDPRDPGQESQ